MTYLKKLLEPSKLYFWFLSEVPLAAVLLYTAAADPAEGYDVGSGRFILYVPATLAAIFFPLLLNWLKGWLVLHFGQIDCGFADSGRLLCRIHSVMALLEAVSTLVLFLFRSRVGYVVLSQIQLFGHELIYAFLFWLFLRERSQASYRRCLAVSLVCFLASSAWLMLSVIAAL